jgi:hypothetical protein
VDARKPVPAGPLLLRLLGAGSEGADLVAMTAFIFLYELAGLDSSFHHVILQSTKHGSIDDTWHRPCNTNLTTGRE